MKTKQQNSLCSQGKGGTGDGRWQVEALGDFAPDLTVDHLDEAALLDDELVEPVEIEHLFGHDRNAVDCLACVCVCVWARARAREQLKH